jgi:two-component sensor histidine kinase
MTSSLRFIPKPVTGPFLRYALAIALFAGALGLRHAFDGHLPPGFPYVTFFPAVIIATFFAGRGPGIVSAALSGLAAWYFFIPPFGAFSISGPVVVALLFYLFVVGVDIALIDGLQARHVRLIESQRRVEQLADHQALLFKELQHRVANNLASVSSMLRLNRREIERDPAVALDVIDRADARIAQMGRIHRQLYDPLTARLGVAGHLAQVVDDTRDVAGSGSTKVHLAIDPVGIETGRLLTLSLLISELLTNSFKHAFAPGTPGEIRISLREDAPDQLILTVSDNGRGMGEPLAGRARGLGTAITKGLVSQLDGRIEVVSDGGVCTTVRFPAG